MLQRCTQYYLTMQKIRELSLSLNEDLEAKRNWVRKHYTSEAIDNYATVEGKLTLLDTILKSKRIGKDETLKLQSLGITLGDIIEQDLHFVWVEVEDEYGIDPALQLPDTTLIVFPQTMISKRIEMGEDFDIYRFYDFLKEDIDKIKHEAQ